MNKSLVAIILLLKMRSTYDASITHVLRPNIDNLESCDCDCKLADENTARLLAKWLKRLPGDAILIVK